MTSRKIPYRGSVYKIEYNEQQEPVKITEYNFDGLMMRPAVRVVWRAGKAQNDLVRAVLERSRGE